jgi:tetratricopeptide (TPR) repeat protein
VATVGGDGTVRVWDAATASPLTPLFRPPGAKRASLDHETVQPAFSADGRRLMLIANGRIWWHDLSPDTRPVEELMQLAELLAGRRIDSTGASLTPLRSAELRQRWEALMAKRVDAPGAGRMRWEDLLAWHRQQAKLAAADGEWTAAAHHWGRLIRAEAKDGEAWRGRGQAHLELGLYTQAVEDFTRATKVDAKDAQAWHRRGRALAAMGRHKDAVADFSQAIKLGRKGEVLEDRADSYAEQEKWAEAVLDLTELTRASLKDPRGGVGGSTRLVYKMGLLYAALGAWKVPGVEKGHHSACVWFAHRFWKETTPEHAKHLAWICGLAPGEKGFLAAMMAYPLAVKMPKEGAMNMIRAVCEGAKSMEFAMKEGELRLKGEPGIGGSAYSPLTANALLGLRLGQPGGVIDLLTKEPPRLLARALKIGGKGDLSSLPAVTRQSLGLDGTPWNDLLLSIALAKKGRGAESEKALQSAVKRIEAGKWPWHERLELRLLRAEAEALAAKGK